MVAIEGDVVASGMGSGMRESANRKGNFRWYTRVALAESFLVVVGVQRPPSYLKMLDVGVAASEVVLCERVTCTMRLKSTDLNDSLS
jgi:hypothetical protein